MHVGAHVLKFALVYLPPYGPGTCLVIGVRGQGTVISSWL